jgi:hypothetical protein
MKKLFAGLLLATAFNSNYVSAGDNIWTFDRLNARDMNNQQTQAPQQNTSAEIVNSNTSTVTITETTAQQANQASSMDYVMTGLKYGAVATGLAVTYLYGPAALFWGTYYTSSWALGKLGITGITGLAAATKAGIAVADSSLAQTALVGAGALIANYGADAVVKTAQVVGKASWSFGNWLAGSKQPEATMPTSLPSTEELRNLRLQRFTSVA